MRPPRSGVSPKPSNRLGQTATSASPYASVTASSPAVVSIRQRTPSLAARAWSAPCSGPWPMKRTRTGRSSAAAARSTAAWFLCGRRRDTVRSTGGHARGLHGPRAEAVRVVAVGQPLGREPEPFGDDVLRHGARHPHGVGPGGDVPQAAVVAAPPAVPAPEPGQAHESSGHPPHGVGTALRGALGRQVPQVDDQPRAPRAGEPPRRVGGQAGHRERHAGGARSLGGDGQTRPAQCRHDQRRIAVGREPPDIIHRRR